MSKAMTKTPKTQTLQLRVQVFQGRFHVQTNLSNAGGSAHLGASGLTIPEALEALAKELRGTTAASPLLQLEFDLLTAAEGGNA